MYIGTFYCNRQSLYFSNETRVELGDLSDINDPDFGGYLTLDGTATGTPIYGLYAPNAFFKGRLVLAGMDLDDLNDGETYGRILSTSIEAGKILLSESVGSLDDIEDGSTYGKVAITSIESGRIIVAGLDSGVTERMFSNANIKDNIEAWKHNSDITMIDGGKIYTNTISLEKLSFSAAESDKIVATINASTEGIRIAGQKIQIDGNVTFGTGYDPSEKLAEGQAADDINNGTTTIHGSKIETGTITALGAVTAGSFNLGSGKFVVDALGNLSATTAVIDGTINGYDLADFQKYNDQLWDQVNNPQTGVDARLLVIEGDISNNHIITDTVLASSLSTALASYATLTNLSTHADNSTVHITSLERNAWNAKVGAVEFNALYDAVEAAGGIADRVSSIEGALGSTESTTITIGGTTYTFTSGLLTGVSD